MVESPMREKSSVPPPPPPPPSPTTLSAQQKKIMAMIMAKERRNSIKGQSLVSTATRDDLWERLFDQGYRADVVVHTDHGAHIFAHASILGMASPVIRQMLKQSKGRDRRRSISIHGVPHDAVRLFIRFLYSSCYDPEEMKEFVLQLLVLSHSFVVPHLKRECETQLENGMLNIENVVDVFQLALLCDAPRLSFICHSMISGNFKAVSATDGWRVMKEAHPFLEMGVLDLMAQDERRQKEWERKRMERKMYIELHEAMEALVHIYKEGCKTIGPHDKAPKKDEAPCGYTACKGLELLVRHFASCKLRVPGGCAQCKRMWQLLELHSRLCADSDQCRVPLCRNFRERSGKQNKKEEIRWKILARKILRSKSISGAPFFSLVASSSS